MSEPPAAVDPATFRHALGRFVSGVTVVSVEAEGERHGITVSSFMSLSLHPPLVGVSIDHRARAFALLSAVDRYGVSILARGQKDVSARFAGAPSDLPPRWDTLAGVPVVSGAIAHLACHVVDRVVTGDHTLFVGRVERTHVTGERPLAYWSGGYRFLSDD